MHALLRRGTELWSAAIITLPSSIASQATVADAGTNTRSLQTS